MEPILTKSPANKQATLIGWPFYYWVDRYISRICSWVGLVNPIGHWYSVGWIYYFGRHNAPSASLHTSPYWHTRPSPFLSSAHLPTRRPSSRTRWRKSASPSLGWDRAQSMPTGFLPNPVSPTRRPSRQTRWKKVSFALVRLATKLRVCRRASYRIPSRQPEGHRVKPDGESQPKFPRSPMYIYYIWYIYSYNRYLYIIYKYKYAL